MKPNRFLIFSSLLILTIFLAGVWASTQFAAKWLAYQPQLGPPMVVLKGVPIYFPLKILIWVFHYHAYAPKIFDKALLFSFAGSILGVCVAVGLALLRAKKPKELTSHGTARWADHDDLEKAKLLDGKGIVLGVSKEGEYLRHDGPEPALVYAPTRAGKGVSIIVPTLLTWPHSVIATDIKGENWGITSGFRKHGLKNITMKFDPTANDGTSVKFNPLAEVRLGTDHEVRDVQNIVDIIIDPQGTGNLDHWEKTGHALLVGAILHVLYSHEYSPTLAGVANLFSDPKRDFTYTLLTMRQFNHLKRVEDQEVFRRVYGSDSETHPVVAHAAQALINKDEKERSGVLSTALSFLELYQDPVIARNTACSEFAITDLMNHEKPVSLYLVIPSSDLLRVTPLTRIILNLIVTRLTEKMEFKDGRPVAAYNHRLLLLLDEFPAFGKLENFEKQLAFMAGYGIKPLLIVQSLNQLFKTYGDNNSIIDNSHVRAVFTPNTVETAERVSRMLGQQTELVQSQTYSGHRLNPWLTNASFGTQEIGRPLMTPDEVLVMPYDDELLFVTGFPPIKANKLIYYQDENFTKRLKPAPAKSDVCRIPPPPPKLEPPGDREEPDELEESEEDEGGGDYLKKVILLAQNAPDEGDEDDHKERGVSL